MGCDFLTTRTGAIIRRHHSTRLMPRN